VCKVRRDIDPLVVEGVVFLAHPVDRVAEFLPWDDHEVVVEPLVAHTWALPGAVGIFGSHALCEQAAARYDRWRERLLSRCSGCRPGWRRYCPI
jgi:hypothetical protein